MNKLIAIYGSPGSGKTTLAVSLATLLSKKYSVIVLSTSRIVPMLRVLAPKAKIDKTHSVGGLFLTSSFSQEDVCKKIVFHPKHENIGFMGLASGDTPNTYNGVFTREKVANLYTILGGLVDYLIVDCMSNISPANDALGNMALSAADLIIKTLTADVMGVEYNTAILPLTSDLGSKRHLTALSNNTAANPLAEVKQVIGTAEYYLPRSAEIADFFLSGNFENSKTDDGKSYLNEVAAIIEKEVTN